MRVLRWLSALLAGVALHAYAGGDARPEHALRELLTEARSQSTGICRRADADRLTRILCNGRLRVGVRDEYPLFATQDGGTRAGYEIDIARAIAARIGVGVEFVPVTPSTRLSVVASDAADVVIATLGHDDQRDGLVRFIRPHYYQSRTVVVGPRTLNVYRWEALAGRSVCVTLGNRANQAFVARDVRLMLFDHAITLEEHLRDGACMLVAQDESFFSALFADSAFSRTHDVKFGFDEVPWGMIVARGDGAERLATALDLASQIFHRDGVFLELARRHGIATAFLEEQHATWRHAVCDRANGRIDPNCVLPPLSIAIAPTSYASQVTAFEGWIRENTGIRLELPMLKTEPALVMFRNGIVNSLGLVGGTLVATLLCALAIGTALASRHAVLRGVTRAAVVTCQSTPVVLAVVIAAALANALFQFSAAVAILTAIVTLGLTNGAYAGQALAEALHTLRVEAGQGGAPVVLGRAVARSSTQLMAFLVNATKGTPVASFIGAPELLSELTDISSIASGRTTTYLVVLVFYTAVVFIVVALCARLRAVLEQRYPA